MSNRFAAQALPGVRTLMPYEPGKPLSELEREYGIQQAIKLASNENPLGPSTQAFVAAKTALAEIARYPDGNGFVLKQALAEHLGVAPAQITLGNGSNDVLELVARAFAGPGHEVIFSEHAFAVYALVTQAVGAQAVIAPAQDWGHDLTAIGDAINKNTRVVFIANPNNPTGTWLRRAALASFLARVPEQVLVVIDEAYFEYVDEDDYPHAIDWLPQWPNLIVTRTFSKIFGLAGLRIGYSVSHSDIADLLNRIRQPFNVNGIAQAAALAALADQEHLQRSFNSNHAGMQQLLTGLDELGLAAIPSVANFICVDLEQAATPIYEALLHQGVIVRPVANYGMPNHLRVTIGLPEENDRFLTALQAVW